MTPLDLLDQSFMRRRSANRCRTSVAACAGPAAATGAGPAGGSVSVPVAEAIAESPARPPVFAASAAPPASRQDDTPGRHGQSHGSEGAGVSGAMPDPFVARLLGDAPLAWRRVADCVADAHGRGRRSIAVTGSRHGEGRSTLVQGVAHLLRGRGLEVACVDRPELADWRGDTLTLVDAGIWFPPGPLRRQPLLHRSIGCDAVIIVRRADQAPCPARAAVVESVGLELLGEVVTFAPADQAPDRTTEGEPIPS